MTDVGALTLMRYKTMANRLRLFRKEPILKVGLLLSTAIGFWWLLYRLFLDGFEYAGRIPDSESVIEAVLYVFFFSLTIMLTISNAIISYISFFKAKESEFLLATPTRVENLFMYKATETLIFSSLALLFLATPLISAYGASNKFSWQFFVVSYFLFAIFTLLPAVVGSTITLLITAFLPRSKRAVLFAVCGAIVILVVVIALRVFSIRGVFGAEYAQVKEVLDSVSFSRNPILPSYWLAKSILVLGGGEYSNALFYAGMIIANILFIGAISYILAEKIMLKGWFVSQGLLRNKKYLARNFLDKVGGFLFIGMSKDLKSIIVKDMKSFVRNPAYWSQFLIFFGLLTVYFLNLRTLKYDEKLPGWKGIVAGMNLFATAATFATFTTRFIFPQLSLEGRRFWVIGMAPIERGRILTSKLLLSSVTGIVLCLTLITVSGYMLAIPVTVVFLQCVSLFGIALGLSGLAVGLGALYPNFKEDNPSKIISGFGGTLNVVLSLGFVTLMSALQFYLIKDYFLRGSAVIGGDGFVILVMMAITTLLAYYIPMLFGYRAIRRLEI